MAKKDFSSKQPTPQKRPSTEFDARNSGEPADNSPSSAPRVGLADTAAGPGIPPNSRKIR